MTIEEYLKEITFKCANCKEDHPLSDGQIAVYRKGIRFIRQHHPEATDDEIIEQIELGRSVARAEDTEHIA